MNKYIIIAIVASSILLIVSVLVWVIVSRRWPSSAIEELRNQIQKFNSIFNNNNWSANEKECIIDYYTTSVSFRKFDNMNASQRNRLFIRAINHCNLEYLTLPPSVFP